MISSIEDIQLLLEGHCDIHNFTSGADGNAPMRIRLHIAETLKKLSLGIAEIGTDRDGYEDKLVQKDQKIKELSDLVSEQQRLSKDLLDQISGLALEVQQAEAAEEQHQIDLEDLLDDNAQLGSDLVDAREDIAALAGELREHEELADQLQASFVAAEKNPENGLTSIDSGV